MTVLSDEKARQIAETVSRADSGLYKLKIQLRAKQRALIKGMTMARNDILRLEGALKETESTLEEVEKLILALDLPEPLSAVADTPAGVVVQEVSPETQEKIEKGRCIFVSRVEDGTKKACKRKALRGSEYCAICMKRMGLLKPVASLKPKKTRAVPKRKK